MPKKPDDLPDPLDMSPSEAFDCLDRLRRATDDIWTELAERPDLQARVYERLRAAWRGEAP